mgnify:CR=1 FL=1
MYLNGMIYRIENYVNEKTGHIIESITPSFGDDGKPILMAIHAGFKGKEVIGVKFFEGLNVRDVKPCPIEFPIEANNLLDAFAKFVPARDAEMKQMQSNATKQFMAAQGPKMEFFVP